MIATDEVKPKLHNRNYDDMHRLLIETAGELITKRGAGAVTIAALARAMDIHRTTVYYHFNTREALLAAAQKYVSEQSAKDAEAEASRWCGIDHILDLVCRDPEVMTTWIDDYIAAGEIRQRYPEWDRVVAQLGGGFAELAADERCDSEVYCALVMTSAFLVPRTFTSLANPFAGLERMLEQLQVRAEAYVATEAPAPKSARPTRRLPARRYGVLASASRSRAARP